MQLNYTLLCIGSIFAIILLFDLTYAHADTYLEQDEKEFERRVMNPTLDEKNPNEM